MTTETNNARIHTSTQPERLIEVELLIESDDMEALRAAADEMRTAIKVLRVPRGVSAEDHAELLANLYEEVLSEAGLAAYDQKVIAEHASAADLIVLLRGQDLDPSSQLLAALRGDAHRMKR